VTIIDGKHVGDCKEGQQPGDMTLPNGQHMNIRNWMGEEGLGTRRLRSSLHSLSRTRKERTCRTTCTTPLQTFKLASGAAAQYYSLPALEAAGVGRVSRLPVSIRIVLESVLRNCDGKKVTAEHVKEVANWAPTGARTAEIPFVVARVVLQDFTGVPLLADLAAMRNVASDMGRNPEGDRAARARSISSSTTR
jgi:hypothetical protein